MEENCLFCRIARGDVPAHEVFRDDHVVAFLDTGPIRPGHLQIIPVDHYPYFDDLPSDLAARIVGLGQRLAKAQKSCLAVERVALLFTGGDVAHAHAHLVPMFEATDITSRCYIEQSDLTFRSLPNPGKAALTDMASLLTTALSER
ncbi:MAG: HIT domain-containing protein [Thalassobaculaceae bacterium]|jgi:histidine triad (HIT) family protein